MATGWRGTTSVQRPCLRTRTGAARQRPCLRTRTGAAQSRQRPCLRTRTGAARRGVLVSGLG
eukprot:13810473-Alexandrium_andersonii.AAC.1